MKKYGIDIVNEWGNVHNDKMKGVKFFDHKVEAIEWGDTHTHEDDPIACDYYVFEVESDIVIFSTFPKYKDDPIKSRFEILDI